MFIHENTETTEYLNKVGVREGDKIFITPMAGKRSNFLLNRTCIDFVCDKANLEIESMAKRKISSMKNEIFHVQLRLIELIGNRGQKLKRYFLEVKKGGAVKLNGNYIMSAFVERGDICEVGYNTIHIKESDQYESASTQDLLIEKNLKIVRSKLPILIEGETGVGKTSLARKIHERSLRNGRFVHINISSFAAGLIESELFGHKKGAFTGAFVDKLGAFREAQHGTLFIDEVDSLPIELQTKLLLFFDDFKARAVGSDKSYQVKTRLIFASGRSLKTLVESNLMRRDFYFRLSSGENFKLNALRNTSGSIEKYCQEYGRKEGVIISHSLLDFYKSLPWPGNYRQLKGHLERKKVLSSSRKFIFDYMDEKLIEQSSALVDLKEDSSLPLQDIKIAYAKRVFFQCQKNYTHAAKRLHISVKSLKTLLQNENYF
jgi:DNA-binding NtrC family response regulator